MEPVLVLSLISGVLGAVGIGYMLNERAKELFVNRTRTQWVQAGHTIQWGPVGISCYGTQPKSLYAGAFFGVMAIMEHQFVFLGHRNSNHDARIPLDRIQGIAHCTIREQRGKTSVQKNVVEIHTEEWGQWRIFIFSQFFPDELLSQIQRHTGRAVPQRSTPKQILPSSARRMSQDVYGQWIEEDQGQAYLAPDRIIFDRRSLIYYAQIRQIEVFERGGLNSLNPFAQELVRIEYTDTDGEFQVIGFLMRSADSWAASLSNHTSILVKSHVGRKKKD